MKPFDRLATTQSKRMASRGLSLGVLVIYGYVSAATAQSTTDSQQNETVAIEKTVVVGETLQAESVTPMTALKTPTPLIDIPQSVSVVTAEQIERQGFDSIGDIIDYTPGVNNSQGEGHRDAVVFRGVRSTADFFMDGMRDDVQYYRPLYNIEQVEILRGPNALLFGRGGTGGIINRVSKKGIIGETFKAYKGSIDTFGQFNLQFDGNIEINDTSAFRINTFYEDLANHRDFYDGTRIGANPTARFLLSDATTLDVSYEYVDHERFIDRGIPTGSNGLPVGAFQDIVFGDPDLNFSELDAHLLRATIEHQFMDELVGNFNLFYGDYDKLYQNFYASAYDQATTPDEVTLDGYLDETQRENLILASHLVGEFSSGDIEHTVIFGGEFVHTLSDQNRFNPDWNNSGSDTEVFAINRPLNLNGGSGINAAGNPTSTGFTAPNDNTSTELNVFSAYIQDEIELIEELQLVLGARFDSFDIEVYDNLANQVSSRKDQEISPRLGLIYKPYDNLSIYASYSETFLPQSGEQFADLGDEGLEPDEYINLEAGVKWDWNERLSLTTSIFELQQDAIVSDGVGGSRTEESEITGLELQLQGAITDKWNVSAGYSYLDGEQADGKRPRELPRNMFSMWNTYKVTEQFGLGLGLIYQDESFITEDNDAKLPSYVRVDAAAYYTLTENVRLQLNIENLTDELYYPNAHSTHQATVGAPIHARFSISGRF